MVPPDAPPQPLTAADIDRVMQAFYAEIRAHPELGPVFNRHVGTDDAAWRAHEAKIAGFWRKALLKEPGYDGNPMAVHLAAGDVRPGHFDPWLNLFETVTHRVLPAPQADAWTALARRIGRGLRMGIVDRERPAGEVPRLF